MLKPEKKIKKTWDMGWGPSNNQGVKGGPNKCLTMNLICKPSVRKDLRRERNVKIMLLIVAKYCLCGISWNRKKNKRGLSCAKLGLKLTCQLSLLQKASLAYFWLFQAILATFHLIHLTYFQKFPKISALQMLKSMFGSWLAISSYLRHLPLRLPSMEVVCHL